MAYSSVLVVDDEPDNFDVIESLLSDRPYQLHYVSNGIDALESLDLFQPDVILLDVMMPGLDGIEVCARIKAMPNWHTVPIVIVTALTEKKTWPAVWRLGPMISLLSPLTALNCERACSQCCELNKPILILNSKSKPAPQRSKQRPSAIGFYQLLLLRFVRPLISTKLLKPRFRKCNNSSGAVRLPFGNYNPQLRITTAKWPRWWPRPRIRPWLRS